MFATRERERERERERRETGEETGEQGKWDPPRSGSGHHHTCQLRWVGPTRGTVTGAVEGGE